MTIRTDHNGSTGNARRSGAASGTARAPRTARTPWGTRLAELAMLAPTVTALALLFGGGLAGAIRQSLHPTIDASGPLDPSAWTAVLHDPAFLDALRFSLRTALVATGLSAALAIPIASALRHRGMLPRFLCASQAEIGLQTRRSPPRDLLLYYSAMCTSTLLQRGIRT